MRFLAVLQNTYSTILFFLFPCLFFLCFVFVFAFGLRHTLPPKLKLLTAMDLPLHLGLLTFLLQANYSHFLQFQFHYALDDPDPNPHIQKMQFVLCLFVFFSFILKRTKTKCIKMLEDFGNGKSIIIFNFI